MRLRGFFFAVGARVHSGGSSMIVADECRHATRAMLRARQKAVGLQCTRKTGGLPLQLRVTRRRTPAPTNRLLHARPLIIGAGSVCSQGFFNACSSCVPRPPPDAPSYPEPVACTHALSLHTNRPTWAFEPGCIGCTGC